jgi:hypothetical protein
MTDDGTHATMNTMSVVVGETTYDTRHHDSDIENDKQVVCVVGEVRK